MLRTQFSPAAAIIHLPPAMFKRCWHIERNSAVTPGIFTEVESPTRNLDPLFSAAKASGRSLETRLLLTSDPPDEAEAFASQIEFVGCKHAQSPHRQTIKRDSAQKYRR